MLTLVRKIYQEDTPKSEDSEDSDKSDKKLKVLPPGTPYLAKVNGRLVMARDKHSRTVSMATSLKGDTVEKKPRRPSRVRNLLGEVFGAPTGESIRTHRRSASAAPSMCSPVMLGGIPHVLQPLYSAPLQQQPFPPYYSVAPTPQLLQQPAFTFPAPEPAKTPRPEEAPEPEKVKATEEEKEQLREIHAHYQKVAAKDLQRHASDPAIKSRVETTTKTTITITRHICAQCGRIRSNQYHHENPIKPDEEPVPAFCKKCQREASPTSISGSDRDRKNGRSKDKRRWKQKKYTSSPSEESSPPRQHRRRRSVSEQPRPRVGFKDPVYARKQTVEYEIKGFGTGSYVRLRPTGPEVDADQRQSRGRTRQRGRDEEAKPYGRDLSPIINQSDSAYQRYEPVIHGARRGESSHQRSPSPLYRYVEAPAYYKFPPRPSEEDIPSGLVEGEPIYDHVHDAGIPLRRKSQKISSRFFEGDQDGSSDSRRRDFYNFRHENKVPSRMPSLDDEHESLNSSRSFASSTQRRPKERPTEHISRPREESRRPRPTERVVIKETYHNSRTRPRHEAERRGETVDRTDSNARDRTQTFQERREAANYYVDDWGSHTITKPAPRRTSTGFRRDRYQDSELGHSEASYGHRKAFHDIPRAPTPPSRAPSSAHESRRAPGYPFGSESDIASRKERRNREKAPQRYHSPEDNYSRRSSTARAYEERAERAVVLPPIHSRQTSQTYFAHHDENHHKRSWVDGADSKSWTESDPHRWDERKDNVNPGDAFGNSEQKPGAWEHQRKRGASFGSNFGEDLFC